MTDLALNIATALSLLGTGTTFSNFDLELSPSQINAIEHIQVSDASYYESYGTLDNKKVQKYIENLDPTNKEYAKEVADTISYIVSSALKGFNQEASWVSIRPSTSNNYFDIPRWHTDGCYYLADGMHPQYKIVLTLKGPGTLFYNLPDNLRDRFNELQYIAPEEFKSHNLEKEMMEQRIERAQLIDNSKIIKGEVGKGYIFTACEQKYATVHSEPKMDGQRLFISIYPETFKNIKELEERWEKK